MHPESLTNMPCDKFSPRPSPQHSKSLTAPLDCTNCSKQQSNPINNYMSKWKYKEDLAKPLNMKKTRPRKQPPTTCHFPLTHCSVNTFNPNNKQSEGNEETTPTTPESPSPTESPREASPRDPSPRDRSPISPRSPRNNLSPRTSLSPRGNTSPRSSPRPLSRETLLKQHRAQLQQLEHTQKRQDEELPYDYPMTSPYQRSPETPPERQSYDYHMSSPKKHRRATSLNTLPTDPSATATEISSICNPTYDPPSSPQSSDDNDENYSSDPSPFTGNCAVRDSRKRRSSGEGMECETIEISDGESEYLTHPTAHYRNACTFQSRRFASIDPPSPPPPPRTDPISLRPLSLHTAHNDLAKYHLEAPAREPYHNLPPLNLTRLPSIGELWPMDDCNPRLQHNSSEVRYHPRSQSFPCHYS